MSWQWFSNGDPIGSSQVVSWDFDVDTHNILLTVTDDEGETGAIGATIIVTEEDLQVVTLTALPNSGYAGDVVTITGSGFTASAPVELSWGPMRGGGIVGSQVVNAAADQVFAFDPDTTLFRDQGTGSCWRLIRKRIAQQQRQSPFWNRRATSHSAIPTRRVKELHRSGAH